MGKLSEEGSHELVDDIGFIGTVFGIIDAQKSSPWADTSSYQHIILVLRSRNYILTPQVACNISKYMRLIV